MRQRIGHVGDAEGLDRPVSGEWDELKALALAADQWRDEWNSDSTDGSAVGNYLDAVRPDVVLRLIAAAELAERLVSDPEPTPEPAVCDRCRELIHDHDCPSVGDGRPSEAPPPFSRWVVPSGWTFSNLGTCRTCRAEVAWCRTPAGKPAPVNPDGVSHFATCPQADQHRRSR